METELLREYLVIADELNFTHAAKRLHTTQSTLSKHVAALEREFGEPLFKRGRRGMDLTEAGSVLYRRASTVVDLLDGAKAEIAHLRKSLSVRVVGMLQNGDVMGLLSRVARTVRAGDLANLSLVPTSLVSATAMVVAGEADVAIDHKGFSGDLDPSLARIDLYSDRLLALVEADHELADRRGIAVDDLRNYTLAHLSGSYAEYGWANVRRICMAHGFDPKSAPLIMESMLDALTYPLDDLVLLLQRGMTPIESFVGDQRSCIPVTDDDALFTVCAYYRQDDEERLRPFLEVLRREAAHMGVDGDDGASGQRGRFRGRCRALAQRIGLNESEEAAMGAFARGRSIDRIAEDMGLSRVMVGDLLASVYQKAAVRDRQGLLDSIEAEEVPW